LLYFYNFISLFSLPFGLSGLLIAPDLIYCKKIVAYLKPKIMKKYLEQFLTKQPENKKGFKFDRKNIFFGVFFLEKQRFRKKILLTAALKIVKKK